MTKDQFAYWLVGYITVHKVDSAELDAEEASDIGNDVLEAARSVVSALAPLCAGPVFEREMPLSKPQPGDLDYEDTSKAEGT